jgi:peptidyl-prolyl cis-trans isomerase D
MTTVARSRFIKNSNMSYVVWIALASMLAGYIVPLFLKQGAIEPWAIRVNGTNIPYRTFATDLAANREYISLVRSQYGQFADYLLQSMGFSDVKSMTFQSLVMKEIIKQSLQKNHLLMHSDYIANKVHDAEFVQKQLSDVLPSYFVAADGSIDLKALRTYLKRTGIKFEDFEQKIADKIGNWFLTQTVELFSYTPQYVARYNALQQNSRKGFSYISLAYKDFVAREKKKDAITNKDVADFFERENKIAQRYIAPEKRAGIQWEFTPASYGIVIDDRDIMDYYEQNKAKEYSAKPSTIQIRHIVLRVDEVYDRTATEKKARELHAVLIQNPDAFAEIARAESQDADSAQKGGLLEPFARGTQDKAVERAAFSLQADGDIAPVLELADRFVIIQRVKKEQQTFVPLEKIRNEIEKKLRETAFVATFSQEAGQLESDASTQYNTFITEHKGKKLALSGITRSEKPLAKVLFTLKEGAYGFYLEKNLGYVVLLNSIEPSYTPPLQAVEETVMGDIIAERARTEFNKEGERLLRAVGSESLESVAAAEHIKVHTITPFATQDTDRITTLQTDGLNPKVLLKLEYVGSVTTIEHNDILSIVQCDSIIPDKDAQEQEALEKTMYTRLDKQDRSTLVNGYIASLYRDATIETNDIIAMLEEENSI